MREKFLAVVVHGDFGVVLGEDEQETAEIARVLDIKNAATSEISPRSRHGSDGIRTRGLRLDRPTCLPLHYAPLCG
jgi:hypothetical protein